MSEAKVSRTAAQLRAHALAAQDGRAPVKLELDGETFFIGVPTVGDAAEIQSKSMKVTPGKAGKTDVRIDMAQQKALAILRLVKDDFGKPVFEETDVPAILAAPAGGLIDQLGLAALKQLNVDEEALEGN